VNDAFEAEVVIPCNDGMASKHQKGSYQPSREIDFPALFVTTPEVLGKELVRSRRNTTASEALLHGVGSVFRVEASPVIPKPAEGFFRSAGATRAGPRT
jgi:hypothetical protein